MLRYDLKLLYFKRIICDDLFVEISVFTYTIMNPSNLFITNDPIVIIIMYIVGIIVSHNHEKGNYNKRNSMRPESKSHFWFSIQQKRFILLLQQDFSCLGTSTTDLEFKPPSKNS